jgi:TPR repeat protein
MQFCSSTALLKLLIPIVLVSACLNAAYAQDIENIEVKGKKLERLSPNVSSYNLSQEMGLDALHAKTYKRAFSRLTDSAKEGNKISQFYLASMYFKGQGTPVDNKQGWLWLNAALEQKVPKWRYAYHKISSAIPEHVQLAWQDDVDIHIGKYGAKATNHKCKPHREIGSNIINIVCGRITDGTYEFEQWRKIQDLFFI